MHKLKKKTLCIFIYREIALVKELNKKSPSLKWYYMGYYIHSCPKMRYKGRYSPSYLLCPEAYSWHPIEHCLPKLDLSRYCRFSDENSNVAEEQMDYKKVSHLIFYFL